MIEAKLKRAFASFPTDSTFLIAYSGGLDSTVLLHAASTVAREMSNQRSVSLRAIHIHHGLSIHSDAWAEHCRVQCARLNIPLIIEHVSVERTEGSFELAARTARYAAFKKNMPESGVLLMAHHADDQFETVLMRICRGGDTSLLSGIPEARELGAGALFRPLLGLRRSDLEDYAAQHTLSWIEDESNQQMHIERNRVRLALAPKLLAQDAALFEVVRDLAQRHGALNAMTERLFAAIAPALSVRIFLGEEGLSLHTLKRFKPETQRLLVRWWFRSRRIAQPGAAIFERIWSELIPARADAAPRLDWSGISLRRFSDAIFIVEGPAALESALEGVRQPLLAWSELGKRQKVCGRSKKEWQSRLKIPPWQRPFLGVVLGDGVNDQVIDLRSGRSVPLSPVSHK